jgi:outer membrane receptor protein involved in Fe transport
VRSTALWSEADWTPSPRVSATFGLRWQRDEYEDDETRPAWGKVPLPEDERLLPRAALTYQVAPSWTLSASAGTGLRQPEPAFEEVCCGRRYRGNRGIRHERSRAYGLGARYEPSPRLRVGLSGLLAEFDDLVVKMVTMSFLQQVTYQNVNVESARMTTLSLNVRAEPIPQRVRLTGSYVFLDADNRSPSDRILALVDRANQPAELTFTTAEIPYLATRNATLQLETRWARERVRVRASAQYTGPMTIQRFDGLNYDPQTSMDTITFVETDSFWVYNLGASIDLFGGVSLDFGVDNLTDEVQPGLDDAYTDFIWGPLRGRYAYVGLSYRRAPTVR